MDKSEMFLRKGPIKEVLEWFQNTIMQDDDVNNDVNGKQRMVQLLESIGRILSEPSPSLSIDDQ